VAIRHKFRDLSGGQKTASSLSMLFGLRDIMGQNQKTDMLILDEPWSALDDLRRDGLIEILDDLRTKVGTILMTSHEQEVIGRHHDNVWTVVMENDFSRLVIGD
jgi:DNA repair exonuclease SbcCD ATPase subunit